MARHSKQPARKFTTYFNEASWNRLCLLAEILNLSHSAIIAQAISRWLLQVQENVEDTKWVWYLERPFREGRDLHRTQKQRVNGAMPKALWDQVARLAETLNVSLLSVMEQALLRWCREEPLMQKKSEQRINGADHTSV